MMCIVAVESRLEAVHEKPLRTPQLGRDMFTPDCHVSAC